MRKRKEGKLIGKDWGKEGRDRDRSWWKSGKWNVIWGDGKKKDFHSDVPNLGERCQQS